MDALGEKVGFLLFVFTVMNVSTSPHPIMLLICYGVHEAGHLFFAYITGAGISSFRTSLCRLSIKYDCSGISYIRECFVVGGGIIFNFLLAFVFSLPVMPKNDTVSFFVLCNLSLALMNLYPVNILDGGNMLKCILNYLFSEEKARKILTVISFIFAFILWLFSVYLQLIFSADVSIFLISVLLLMELCFSV